MLQHLYSVVITLVYGLACLSLGMRLMRWLAAGSSSPGPSAAHTLPLLASAFLLGQGVLAGLWLFIALAGLFKLWAVIPLIAAAGLSGFFLLKPRPLNLAQSGLDELRAWRHETPLWRSVILLTVLSISLNGITTFLPPQPRGDALAFYLSFARRIAETGQLSRELEQLDFAQVGLQGEFHYAALIRLGNRAAPELFAWLTALAGAALLSSLAQQTGINRRGKWVLLAALFSSSAFTTVIWDGKVDIFGAALGLAAYYWAFRFEGQARGPLRLAGFFSGLAVIAKISYAVFLPLTVAFLVIWRYAALSQEPRISRAALVRLAGLMAELALWGALPSLPHVVKNALLFDAPLAPLVSSSGAAIVQQSWSGLDTTNRILVTYPFALTFGSFWGQGGQLSPLLLAFVPLILLAQFSRPLRDDPVAQVGLAGLLGIVLWNLYRASVFAPRYIMAPLLLCFIPAAFAAENVANQQERRALRHIIPLAICVTLLLFLHHNMTLYKNALKILAGQAGECDFEALYGDGSCRAGQVVNVQAPIGARVLLASYYDYWLRIDLMLCASRYGELLALQEQSADGLWNYIYERGFEYLIMDTQTHGWLYDLVLESPPPEWITLALLFDASSYQVFHIEAAGEIAPEYGCAQTANAVWRVN